jgi:cytoskeletal protein CcmA (bactofilin family)
MQEPSAAKYQESVIGKSILIKGEITASVPLYVDGCIEGTISAQDQRVTIGSDGKVRADISAGEVVIMGDVCGNLGDCSRVEIRSDGSLTGDLTTDRICIHDGAVVKGAIESGKSSQNDIAETHRDSEPQEAILTLESSDHGEEWENLAVPEPA